MKRIHRFRKKAEGKYIIEQQRWWGWKLIKQYPTIFEQQQAVQFLRASGVIVI